MKLTKILKVFSGWKRPWIITFSVMLGIFTGLGFYTFIYARGISYLHDDPVSCKNCHIMRQQFDGWARSSHHSAATCNSCHTPKNIVGKYAVKAINGWNHSRAFTMGDFSEPIRIKKFNADIVRNNCIECHRDITARMQKNAAGEQLDCISCHGNPGHSNRY